MVVLNFYAILYLSIILHCRMDPSFSKLLLSHGIAPSTISVLEKDVFNTSIFLSLNEAHLQKLVPLMKIGQHAILLQFWREHALAGVHF